ncbi:MBL fold metallo-hydrolase [Alkalicoccus daliensis]|uniref:Glyoxylase, beta-lactamase superfamily II n=1 Tax=Alkalicoccus daliensis TaxID=745820 RepID=A0A1H0E216_9BACI|nr:MBL fold metallo-hydrolase [Alkalicoccus daliensis]SDN76557.1 Glyoxylase, beta-lactamase superfamily II [Alkalicoccus daliensis]
MKRYLRKNKVMPITSIASGEGYAVSQDVFCFPVQIANVAFIGTQLENDDWVLIDAGMPGTENKIVTEVKYRFRQEKPPKAIVLTHGHFDHVGALVQLAERWDVPVYAHKLEVPYLTGEASYPEPDPGVEGGIVANMSKHFPTDPVDVSQYIEVLPEDGSVPYLEGWKWYHTPGHSPGHISLFRESDGILIAGDAFCTVKQDELYKVLRQTQEVHGPPRYFTTDWTKAKKSVEKLRDLNPSAVLAGHGQPMEGENLAEGLNNLADNFEETAVPSYGKYVRDEQN